MGNEAMDKTKWVRLFREIGLDDETMRVWHQKFDADYPNGHQSFLEWLGIPDIEITKIWAL